MTALALVTTASAAQSAPAISLHVAEDAVNVSNVTPGGAVVLFSCARTSLNGRTHVRPRAVTLHDDDGDGAVRLTPEDAVPLRSVWIAVDFTSGATATGAHPRFTLFTTGIPAAAFRKDAEGEIERLDHDIRRLLLLVVRPGTGAWMLFARDGAEGDSDQSKNARLSMSFASARTVEGKAAAPKHLKADDVVAAIDPNHLDIHLTRIVK